MQKICFNFDLIASGMQRSAGGAKSCFAVLDIQALITCGSIWLSFRYCMDQSQRYIAANRLSDCPFGCVDGSIGAVDTYNDPLWRLRIIHCILRLRAVASRISRAQSETLFGRASLSAGPFGPASAAMVTLRGDQFLAIKVGPHIRVVGD